MCLPLKQKVDPKRMQINITGFMEKHTSKFMQELWSLLLSAQKNVSGIPQLFLDEKAAEARARMEEAERIRAEVMKKREELEAAMRKEKEQQTRR